MFSFMFGVLGSLMFWAIFIPVDFIIAVVLLRIIDPCFLAPFTKNKKILGDGEPNNESYLGSMVMILIFMIFWWLIAIIVIAFKIVSLVFPSFVAIMKKVINTVPNVIITNKEK